MNLIEQGLTGVVRAVARLSLGFFFRRIEHFHPERVPRDGPVLLASNHPASVTDALVVGTALGRRVSFVGTVQLFHFAPVGWLLRRCGIIPVNRVKDDPRAMRTVLDTFEACFKVLERGEVVGIFPEGITYEDDQLRPIKSGIARMALDLEHRKGGRLGLVVVPVGLTYTAKDRYRSEVLVHFGEPLRVGDFLAGYEEHRRNCIQRLVAEVEHRLQSLILHFPVLEERRVVEAVKRISLDRLRVGSRVIREPLTPGAEDLVLAQAIAQAVAYFHRLQPDRYTAFVRRLDSYERRLRRLHLSDEDLALFGAERGRSVRVSCWAALAVLGLPIAVFGWLHRLLPAALVEWAARRFTVPGARKAQTAVASMLGGALAFGLFYGGYVALFHHWFGWPASLFYACSLPLAGLGAHAYARETQRLARSLRSVWVMARAPWARRGLWRLRETLRAEVTAAREDYRLANPPDKSEIPNPKSEI